MGENETSTLAPGGGKFEVVEERAGGVCIMRVMGRTVDIEGAATLKRSLAASLSSVPGALLLHLEAVTQVCSLALTVFVEAYRQAKARNIGFAICSVRPELIRVFKETRLDTLFTVYSTESEALTGLSAGGGAA